MSKITFRGAEVRTWDGRFDEKSKTVHTRIKFKSDLSDPVSEVMEWDKISDSYDGVKLHGSLVGRTLVVVPTDDELKRHAFELPITAVEDFNYTAIRDKEGDIVERSITFNVVSAHLGACGIIETYMSLLGRAPAALEVSYEKQENLPTGEETQDGLFDGDGKEETTEEPPAASDDDVSVPVAINDLNRAGSGRRARKQARRQAEMSVEVDAELDERDRVAANIANNLASEIGI